MEHLRITKEQLEKDISACGLKARDTILMHSGLKALGFVEGGADSVIDAILSTIGPEGTLMVPAFSYSYSGKQDAVPFDVKTTPGARNGAIAGRLRERPEAVRSAHPSHSFAAIGKNAHFLCENHPPAHAVSGPSPLTRLLELDGRILFLGCGLACNVMLHLAETRARFRYDHLPFRPSWGESYMIASPGGPLHIPVSEHPGCDNRFPIVAEKLLRENRGTCRPVGLSKAYLFSARNVFETGVTLLNQQPDIFLCSEPDCEACGPRRAYLKEIGAIG